jgi:hypothetical protein
VSKKEMTPEEKLLRIVRHQPRTENSSSAEQPLVAIMAPLDGDRVRIFAEGMGVPNVHQFLAQLEAADLWHFARRPLDLDWLVHFWQQEHRLGSLEEMLELCVTERLKETNPDRA